MLNKRGESRHLCLVSDFRRNGFSSFSIVLAISFHIKAI
jgi:hypothetical protein